MSSCAQQSCHVKRVALCRAAPHLLTLTVFLLLFHDGPWSLMRLMVDIDVLSMAEHSLLFGLSALNKIRHLCTHCNTKFLWLKSGATNSYGYKHKYLEVSLKTRALENNRSPIGPMTSLVMFLNKFTILVMNPHLWSIFQFNQEWLISPRWF